MHKTPEQIRSDLNRKIEELSRTKSTPPPPPPQPKEQQKPAEEPPKQQQAPKVVRVKSTIITSKGVLVQVPPKQDDPPQP
jgi:RNA processing factor Prp31